jgi:MerR family transcriptional regulator, heat shock protein HspR
LSIKFVDILKYYILLDSNNINTPVYTISTAAELLGISVHTLRMYEREGLILPYKKESNHRLYSDDDLNRINCIRDAINIKKFTISSIRAMMAFIPCWSVKNCSKSDKESCEAYKGYLQPCWTYKHKNNICELQSCRHCYVYTNHYYCENIKNIIKEKTE